MSVEAIDDYWYQCEFIWDERGDNKALPTWLIEDIKENERTAQWQVFGLFEESLKASVMAVLDASS